MKRALLAIAVVVACAGGIGVLQAPLADRVHKVKLRDDVSALPPPEAIKPMSLGYGSALADIVWVNLLLDYGTHWAKHMYFRDAALFADDIIALDPKHRTLYKYIDTLLIYQPTDTNHSRGDIDDCRAARRYLERGLVEFPYDGEMWLHYGQFIAFMGPAYLKDEQEISAWRVDGAMAITRAMDLGAGVEKTTVAASVLSRAGETRAAIAHLQRALAMTDDEQQREQFAARLRALHESAATDQATRVLKNVDSQWKRVMPFVPRTTFLLLSPNPSSAACAGAERSGEIECVTSWVEVERGLQGR